MKRITPDCLFYPLEVLRDGAENLMVAFILTLNLCVRMITVSIVHPDGHLFWGILLLAVLLAWFVK